MYYTGIGSRDTPIGWCDTFVRLAETLAKDYGMVLRSGHADGADLAFECGCNKVYGWKEIYIPWKGFNHSNSDLVVENIEAFRLAQKYIPYWSKTKDSVRKLYARNMHQVLGNDLSTKSTFIVCYTEAGKDVGGTRIALHVAKDHGIPIFNAGLYGEDYDRFYNDVISYVEGIKY